MILASTPNSASSLSQTAEEPRVPKGNLYCSHLPSQGHKKLGEDQTNLQVLSFTPNFVHASSQTFVHNTKFHMWRSGRKTQRHSKGSYSSAPHHPINNHPKSLSFSHLLLISTQKQISRVIKSSALPTKSLIVLTTDPDQMLG